MFDAGYENIVSIDISDVIVDKMNQIAVKRSKPQLVYRVMDATNMSFQDEEFDYTIDKGTLDALACGK